MLALAYQHWLVSPVLFYSMFKYRLFNVAACPVLLVTQFWLPVFGQIGRDLVEALRDKHGQDSVIASDVRGAGHPFVEEVVVRLSVLDGDVMDSVIEDEEVGTIYHSLQFFLQQGSRIQICARESM